MEKRPTLVFVHGMFSDKWVWENFLSYFSELGYTCKTPNLPFHADTNGIDGLAKIGFMDYVNFILGEIASLDRYVLIGHSMGALVCQKVAGLTQHRPDYLVLISSAPSWGIFALEPTVIKSFLEIMMVPGFWKMGHRMSKEKIMYSMLNQAPEELVEYLLPRIAQGKESGKVMFEIGIWPFDFSRATYVSVKNIKCPVIMFCGTRDRITPLKTNRQIANNLKYGCGWIKGFFIRLGVSLQIVSEEKYSRLEFIEIPDKGHWLLAEPGWQDICFKIDACLKKIDRI